MYPMSCAYRRVGSNSYPAPSPASIENARFIAEITKFLSTSQIEKDVDSRIRHGHGHTQEEMFAIKHKKLGRIPDMVVYPESEEQVASLITAAKEHDTVLLPFGGGTNVTDALRCRTDEKRVIVSVDMRRMNRIKWRKLPT